MEELKSIKNIQNNYRAYLIPTDWCNFKCSYCIQEHKDKEKPSDEVLIERLSKAKKVLKLLSLGPNLTINFMGGEISCFDTLRLIKSLELEKIRPGVFILTSNFSGNNELYRKIDEYLDSIHIMHKFAFSFHGEFFSVEKFVDKIKDLNINTFQKVTTVVNKNNMETANKLKNMLPKNIVFSFQYERSKGDEDIDSAEIQKNITNDDETNGRKIYYINNDKSKLYSRQEILRLYGEKNGFLKTQGWKCNNLTHTIRLKNDKLIFGPCFSEKEAGIDTDNKITIKNSKICNKKHCSLCNIMEITKPNEI